MEVSGYRVSVLGGRHFSPTERSPFSADCPHISPLNVRSNCRCRSPSCQCFSDIIDPDYFYPTRGDYVTLCDGSSYKLQLKNGHGTRCNASVSIDGQNIGTWRLEPWGQITIERPVNQAKKFTFFRIGSSGAITAGLSSGKSENGLIQVRFVPERRMIKAIFENLPTRSFDIHEQSTRSAFKGIGDMLLSSNSFGGRIEPESCLQQMSRSCDEEGDYGGSFDEGGTGLRGHSQQRFYQAGEMPVEESQAVIISIRLVANRCSEETDRIEPLRGLAKGNPIPPPLGE